MSGSRNYLAEALAKATGTRSSDAPDTQQPSAPKDDKSREGTVGDARRPQHKRGGADPLSRLGHRRIPTQTLLEFSLQEEAPTKKSSPTQRTGRLSSGRLSSEPSSGSLKVQEQNSKLQRECEEKALQIIHLRNQEQSLQTDVAHLQNELRLESARSKISLLDQVMIVNELQAEREPLLERCERLERDLQVAREHATTLEGDLGSAIAETESLARTTSHARARSPFVLSGAASAQAWKEKYDRLEESYNSLKESVAGGDQGMIDQVSHLERLLDQEREARQAAEMEAETRLGRVAELEFSLFNSQNEGAGKGGATAATDASAAAARDLQTAENTIKILQHRVENVQEVNTLLEKERSHLSTANKQAREQIDLLEAALEQAHQQSKDDLEAKNQVISSLEMHVEGLRRSQDDSDPENEVTDALTAEVERQREYLRQWSERYQEVVSARSKDKETIETLKRQLSKAKKAKAKQGKKKSPLEQALDISFSKERRESVETSKESLNSPRSISTESAQLGDMDRSLRKIHDLEARNRQQSEQLRLAERESERLRAQLREQEVQVSSRDKEIAQIKDLAIGNEGMSKKAQADRQQTRSPAAVLGQLEEATTLAQQLSQLETELASQRELNTHMKQHIGELELQMKKTRNFAPVTTPRGDPSLPTGRRGTGKGLDLLPADAEDRMVSNVENALHHMSPAPPGTPRGIMSAKSRRQVPSSGNGHIADRETDDDSVEGLTRYARVMQERLTKAEIERDCFVSKCKHQEAQIRELSAQRRTSTPTTGGPEPRLAEFISSTATIHGDVVRAGAQGDLNLVERLLNMFVNVTKSPRVQSLLSSGNQVPAAVHPVINLVCDLMSDAGNGHWRLCELTGRASTAESVMSTITQRLSLDSALRQPRPPHANHPRTIQALADQIGQEIEAQRVQVAVRPQSSVEHAHHVVDRTLAHLVSAIARLQRQVNALTVQVQTNAPGNGW